MTVYILRFDEPIGSSKHQAQFYVGYCRDDRLDERLAEHRAGGKFAASITRAFAAKQIGFRLVFTMPGYRDEEKAVKAWKDTTGFLKARGITFDKQGNIIRRKERP